MERHLASTELLISPSYCCTRLYSHSDPCLFLYLGFKNDTTALFRICLHGFAAMFLSVSSLTGSGDISVCISIDFRTGHLTNLPREKKIKGSYNSLFKTAGESLYVQTHARIGVLIQSQLQIENGQLTTDYAKKSKI